MKFSSKHFAEMLEDYGAPREEMEIVFSVFDGLSKDEFFKILDKIDDGYYNGKINDCEGLSSMARKIIDDFFFVEGEPTATEKDFLERMKKLNLKATSNGNGIAITMQKQVSECGCDCEGAIEDDGRIKDNTLVLASGNRRKFIGRIGRKTELEDKDGRKLKIGDIVMLIVEGGGKYIPIGFVTTVCEYEGDDTLLGCGNLNSKTFNGRKFDIVKIRDVEDLPMNFKFAYSTDTNNLSSIEYHNNNYGVDDYEEEIDKEKMS